MQNVGSMISGSGKITIIIGSKVYTVETDHVSYQDILSALRTKAYSELESLLEVGKQIVKFGKGKVQVLDGVIYYDSTPVHNALTNRIISLMNKKMPFEPMIKFFENVMLNPDVATHEQLYTFLEFNALPICEDGCFFAYKRVTEGFKDFFSGTFDNSVGAIVKMPRENCDSNSANTCSRGLHVCSKDYLPCYQGGAGKMIIVKINPKNVVAVPPDYHNTKMRCCEYTVVAEIPRTIEQTDSKEYFTAPLYTENGEVAQRTDIPVEVADPYELGRDAFERGMDDTMNPYIDDTNDYDRWNEGYDDADNEDFAGADDEDEEDDDEVVEDNDVECVAKATTDIVVTTYHNIRNSKGRFTKRYHNIRDRNGRFVSR